MMCPFLYPLIRHYPLLRQYSFVTSLINIWKDPELLKKKEIRYRLLMTSQQWRSQKFGLGVQFDIFALKAHLILYFFEQTFRNFIISSA